LDGLARQASTNHNSVEAFANSCLEHPAKGYGFIQPTVGGGKDVFGKSLRIEAARQPS